MKVVVSIDSFKGSMSTFKAGEAVREGVLRVDKNANVVISPIADGGEGTVEAVVSATGGSLKHVEVKGPLGKTVTASYGITPNGTCIIEMAEAAGLTLLEESERNPLYTTTFGVGQIILNALDNGCKSFIIGIGGSATNDGGVGMLKALGFEFLDSKGEAIALGAIGLRDLEFIKAAKADKRLEDCKFYVACDVKNPLYGNNGCSVVYGKQKGATLEMINDMDLWLKKYADKTKYVFHQANPDAEGAGAAGGMGFALMTYLNAELKSGIDLVIKETELEKKLEDADIVVTGEGRLDAQSAMGKAPVGVAKTAKKHKKPVIAFSGAVGEGASACNSIGIDAYFSIVRKPCTLSEAMDTDNAYKNLADTAEQVFRLFLVSKGE